MIARPGSERAEAGAAVACVRAAAATPACAVVFVASEAEQTRLRHMPHLRLTGTASAVTAVGFVTVDDIIAVLADASADLAGRDGVHAVRSAMRRLQTIDRDEAG